MSIIFYSMGSACGFCVKAEALLKPQIHSGEVVKKSASEAGGKFNGFPAFESTKTGKTHTGLPKSYEQLAKKLGHTNEGYTDGEIIFYSMPGCGFCVKSKELLKPQIDSGKIIQKPSSEAGGKFNGFPAFESKKTGKTHTGLPQSYEQLVKKLGHSEHYSHSHNAMSITDERSGDSNKGLSVIAIVFIVLAILAILGLIGFLVYRVKK